MKIPKPKYGWQGPASNPCAAIADDELKVGDRVHHVHHINCYGIITSYTGVIVNISIDTHYGISKVIYRVDWAPTAGICSYPKENLKKVV